MKNCLLNFIKSFVISYALTVPFFMYGGNTIYYFINLKSYDPALFEEYKETLANYATFPHEILNFGGKEKLFNYFAFKEPFLKTIFEGYDFKLINSLKNLEDVKYIITEEVPKYDDDWKDLLKYPHHKRILFSYETPISNPRSHDPRYLYRYSKVFTWNKDFVDDRRIFYLPAWIIWIDPMPMITARPSFNDKKLSSIVASYVIIDHELSNHPKRMDFISMCCSRKKNLLDIYGTGWPPNKYKKNYKGRISFNGDRRLNKINTIKNYKFYLAFENTRNVRGYITEKIFEAMAAGCVPIYDGADDVTMYIPKNCFIDRYDFKNDEQLISYMQEMKEDEYNTYIQAIEAFLQSPSIKLLSRAYYKEILQSIMKL